MTNGFGDWAMGLLILEAKALCKQSAFALTWKSMNQKWKKF